MIEQSRHLPLRRVLWNSRDVATAIDEIVADALTHFDHDAFWPAHPPQEAGYAPQAAC